MEINRMSSCCGVAEINGLRDADYHINCLKDTSQSILVFTDTKNSGRGDLLAAKLRELKLIKESESFETPYTKNTFRAYTPTTAHEIKLWCFTLDRDAINKYFEEKNKPPQSVVATIINHVF